jgi:photosystem II stability/assembly factor-like uncharacterized protein
MPRSRLPVLLSILCLAPYASQACALEAPGLAQILPALKPRVIGPANMSGRIVDVAVYEKEPRIQYIASATGGLWKTVNHGVTFKPVFERQSTIALGAVAVNQTNPNIVWVGTGEGNPRNSVSWGDGVYRSMDGGLTWHHLGLRPTRHIGRIVLHPKNPDIAYVAALGHLWGPNPLRGLLKTTDGGNSWIHALDLGDRTGCIDVAMDPEDPDILYAAAYHVRRGPFSGGNPEVQTGPGAGLYKTTDGGATWTQMKTGLPDRPLGRCGLSVSRQDPKVVYAVVQTDKTAVTTQSQEPNSKKLGPAEGGVFRSDDKGKTWTYLNSLCPRPFYYGQIRVDPNDEQRIYVLGVSFYVSKDGGKTFNTDNAARGTHVDYHTLWIDPRDRQHLLLGGDGGLYYSFDRGRLWEHLKNLPVSQFYAVAADSRTPYRVYGGLQDNGTWGGPSATRDSAGITIAEWVSVLGYDGYYCQVEPSDPDTVFCEGQYGRLHRVNVRTGATDDIKPRLTAKDAKTNLVSEPAKVAPLRFNWSSPVRLSPHDGKTLYFGGQYLFRSKDRGETWTIISPDLTRGQGAANDDFGHTLTTIDESPVRAGLLYAGSDDGEITMSPNGGAEWYDLSDTIPGVPAQRWITRIVCSRFDDRTVYLAIDRHRQDDLAPYLFKSTDRGNTWKSIAGDLPSEGPIHVIREDPVNRDLLYAGTEFGLFLSLDGGAHWQKQTLLPTVPVHDLLVHPREGELVIGTHGRGIWIMDVRPLQTLSARVLAEPAHLFPIRPATAFRPRVLHTLGIKAFSGENPPCGAGIYLYLRDAPSTVPVVAIVDATGKQVAELKGTTTAGLQRIEWRLIRAGTPADLYDPVAAGRYTAMVRVGPLVLQRAIDVVVEE